MLILPESWPDESIYSLLAKIARVNGLSPLQVIGLLSGEKHPISVIGCPVNIKHFCEVTKGAYGPPHDLLRHQTVFPALARLGGLSASTLSQVENGATRPELGILASGMTRGLHWRVCRDCVERDVSIYGSLAMKPGLDGFAVGLSALLDESLSKSVMEEASRRLNANREYGRLIAGASGLIASAITKPAVAIPKNTFYGK